MSNQTTIKYASIGTVSHATHRPEDLIETFLHFLEGETLRNGDFLSRPENFGLRDALTSAIGDMQDCRDEDGEELSEDWFSERGTDPDEFLIEEIWPLMEEFAPPFCYFGAHPGDGSDFGFWPIDIEEIKEQVEFCSVASLRDAEQLGIETDPDDSEYPPIDYRGEWLHVNERGNCTLYVREDDSTLPGDLPRDCVSRAKGKYKVYYDREIWSIC